MKNLVCFLLFAVTFSFCKKQSPKIEEPIEHIVPPKQVTPTNKIQLLIVDFTTGTFEGGKEISLSQSMITGDSIPLKINLKPPGDFGNIRIFHRLSNDLLFDGDIIWMGRGEIKFPVSFDSSSTFVHINNALVKPDSSRFQTVFEDGFGPINTTAIWKAISQLKVVQDYLPYNKHIGVFLYTPSVGIGNPAEWDWFVFLSN
ncbi:MAG: hypothetical protein V4635_11355 [Bacteroidota bacterium]